jgi:hypothetical protein
MEIAPLWIASSPDVNQHAAGEDQMATKKQKRQAAATGKDSGTTGKAGKPKPKKKTSRGK